MHINLINRKTSKVERLKFSDLPLKQIKEVAMAALTSPSHYMICLIATSQEDIDLIFHSFPNMPLPPGSRKQAIWTGDLAAFIILNYPNDVKSDV